MSVGTWKGLSSKLKMARISGFWKGGEDRARESGSAEGHWYYNSNHLYDEGDSRHEDFDIGSNERGIPCHCMALGGKVVLRK